MIIKANAKLNLSLNVHERGADGYHELESIFMPVTLCDTLSLKENDAEKLRIFCTDGSLNNKENIIHKAYSLMRQNHPKIKGVSGCLVKCIPMQAGLGGGSADAAAMISALNSLFGLELSKDVLFKYAAKIGADVPACLLNKPAIATGRGDVLQPIDTAMRLHFILIKPKTGNSTKEMYDRIDEQRAMKPLEARKLEADTAHVKFLNVASALAEGDLKKLAANLHNDFEACTANAALVKLCKDVLKRAGASATLMTGSGSCVFGIFEDAKKRDEQYERFLLLQRHAEYGTDCDMPPDVAGLYRECIFMSCDSL